MNQLHPIIQRLTLSPDQQKAAVARGADVVVTAGAGTGKTRTLVARYLSLLAEGIPLRRIVAITFTRKAAREMRNRVRQELDTYLETAAMSEEDESFWTSQYTALDAARIYTIHSFCTEILRAHPAQAGLIPRFDVLDEAQGNLLRIDAVEAAMNWATDDPELVKLFTVLSEMSLRHTLDALLKKRLETHSAFANLPAGGTAEAVRELWQKAISQKQQETVDRLLADPEWNACITTLRQNQAVNPNDKQEQQRRLVLAAVTEAAGDALLADKLRSLDAVRGINLTGGGSRAWPGGSEQLGDVKSAFRGLRAIWKGQSLLSLQLNDRDDALAGLLPLLSALFNKAHGIYQSLKLERYALDFDDLEAGAIDLLSSNEGVRRHWQSTVGALLVDEFQDTNGHQLRLVRLLCPDPGKLFIVGDAKQSIYRFRGADVAVFRQERAAIEAAAGTSRHLDTSYRAHRALVEGLNDLLRPVMGDALANRSPWEAEFAPLSHHREEAVRGVTDPYIELHLAVGTKAKGALARAARGLAQRLAGIVQESDLRFDDIAILCRASNSFGAYEDALDEAGIPFMTVSGKGFYNRPEIRDLLNSLQAIADPTDDLALAGLLRSPACGLSDQALYRLGQAREKSISLWQALRAGVTFDGDDALRLPRVIELIRTLNRHAGRTALADILKALLDETGYKAALRLAGQHRAARNVEKLLADAHDSGLVSIGAFLAYVSSLRDSGSREGEARATADGAVQIMSVHAAKGLEFPIIVIGDAGYRSRSRRGILIDEDLGVTFNLADESGQKPAIYALSQELERLKDAAETKRLFYVAATRAEQKLLISGCMSLHEKTGQPSRLNGWLNQLAGTIGLSERGYGEYDEEGDRSLQYDLQLGQTPVALTLYEPGCPAVRFPAPAADTTADVILPPPLLGQVVSGTEFDSSGATLPDRPSRPQRVWQVVDGAGQRRAPGWIIGSLVHEALAAWRFPGHGFDRWTRARAREYGLAEGSQLAHAISETAALLHRFRDHLLYKEMNEAERRLSELPYHLAENGRVERGIIDALYLHNGAWTLVDFKTDRLSDKAGLDRLLAEKHYLAQVSRYRAAVQQSIGHPPKVILCMMNVGGRIHLVNPPADAT